jgi:hypothetical protein
MPTAIIELTGAADFTEVSGFLFTTDGFLEAAIVFPKQIRTQPFSAYAELALYQGGQTLNHRIAILLNGYITAMSSPFWTGKLSLISNIQLGFRLWTNTATQYKAVIKTTIIERPLKKRNADAQQLT